jgi:glycerophosphoryl diester phosphodiesterase
VSRTALPYFAPPRPRVIAHRGLAVAALENSLAAFGAALEAGADYLETDAHATADGRAVLLHDPGLRRIAQLSLRIESLTLAELRAIGPIGAEICTLIDALQTFPSARFNIDVKSADAVGPVARDVLAAGASDRVLIASFSSRRRRATAGRVGAAVATSGSAPQVAVALIGAAMGFGPLVRAALRRVDALQIPERLLGLATTTPRMLRAFHRAGVEVHIWTVNDPPAMRRLLAAGVDGIVTDRCDVLAEVVRGRG